MEASTATLGDENAVGEADSLECGFFWGVCHPASVTEAKSVDEAIDVWSIEELKSTSFVGQPVTLGHKDAEVAGTIIEDITDPETGRKHILTYLPPSGSCSITAQELFRSGGFEPELSIRHGFDVLCSSDNAAVDSYDVKKTPIHVGICAFGRRPNCRIQFSAAQKITPTQARRWERHTALLRERASQGVSTHFSEAGGSSRRHGVMSAGANTPQTVDAAASTPQTAGSGANTPQTVVLPLISADATTPSQVNTTTAAMTDATDTTTAAAAAVLPPATTTAAAAAAAEPAPATITPQTSLFGKTSEELAQNLVTLVGKRAADVARIAELEKQLLDARTAVPAAAPAAVAAPVLSNARFENMLKATLAAATREAGLDPTIGACSEEELRAMSANLPGTMMLMNGIVSAAHSANQDKERAQAQLRDLVERKRQKRSAEADSLKPREAKEQRRLTLEESMAKLDSLASRDPTLLDALGIAPRAAAPPSQPAVKLEQPKQAAAAAATSPYAMPNFGTLMRPRMTEANSAGQRQAVRVAQPYVDEELMKMRDSVNAQLKKTQSLSQKELVQFLGDGDNTLI